MATFNTAFGSLPTPKQELFGNTPTAQTKPKATGQIEQDIAPPATMNFADLQKNGRARPAPPPAQVAPPPMLSSLQEQLRQPVAPVVPEVRTTVPPMLSTLQASFDTTAPVASAPPTTTAVAPVAPVTPPVETGTMTAPPSLDTVDETAVTTPPMGGGGAGPGGPGEGQSGLGGGTGFRPEVTTYNAGTTPPPDAPDGATFTAANGMIWTKRGGVWGQNTGQGTTPGYGALVPPEIVAANAGRGGDGFNANSLDQFLRTNGTPSTPEELATLAQNAGMTVPQLQAFINRHGPQDPLRYESQQTLAGYKEQSAWMTQNKVERIPDGYAYVPASAGGPGLRRKTYDERVADGFNPYGGRELYDNPNNQYLLEQGSGTAALLTRLGLTPMAKPEGFDQYMARFSSGGPPIVNWDGRPSAPTGGGTTGGGGYTGGGTPGTVSYQPTGTGTAGLPDINGLLARLSGTLTTGGGTPATAGTPAFAGSPQALALRQQLEAQLAKLASGDDAQRKAFEATRAARGAELTAQYGAERSKLEEELAARGLSASTIGGGRYGDLAGQQARATASFEAEMLKQQSEAEARDRALYMSTMSDLAGMAGTQDLGAYEANLKTKQIEADIGFRAAELQQEAALKGRDLSLQEARDRATAQYQSGQLGLGYAEMRSREQMQREDQTFRAGESALERQLRLSLQKNDIQAQADLARLDRDLRSQIATGELTLNQGIAVSNIAQRIFDGTLPIEAWETLLRSLGIDPAKYPKPQPRVSGGGGGGGSGGSGGGSAGDGSKF